MSRAMDRFRAFVSTMAAWENSIPNRMHLAESEERDGEEGRLILSELASILARFCTERLIRDPKSRRGKLFYEKPSPYGFLTVECSTEEIIHSSFICHDSRWPELESRHCYHLKFYQGEWLIDLREYLPSDGTPSFTVEI